VCGAKRFRFVFARAVALFVVNRARLLTLSLFQSFQLSSFELLPAPSGLGLYRRTLNGARVNLTVMKNDMVVMCDVVNIMITHMCRRSLDLDS